MALTIYGSSDDLIEIEGEVHEEFTLLNDQDGDILGFSDGTVLRVQYTNEGVWRIARLRIGTAECEIVPAVGEDDPNYSDRATLSNAHPLVWVVHGNGWATA